MDVKQDVKDVNGAGRILEFLKWVGEHHNFQLWHLSLLSSEERCIGENGNWSEGIRLINQFVLQNPNPLLDQTSGWVSIKDKLPESFVDVIVYLPRTKETGVACLNDIQEYWYLDTDNEAPVDSVSHWQPLPEPPEVK